MTFLFKRLFYNYRLSRELYPWRGRFYAAHFSAWCSALEYMIKRKESA